MHATPMDSMQHALRHPEYYILAAIQQYSSSYRALTDRELLSYKVELYVCFADTAGSTVSSRVGCHTFTAYTGG